MDRTQRQQDAWGEAGTDEGMYECQGMQGRVQIVECARIVKRCKNAVAEMEVGQT